MENRNGYIFYTSFWEAIKGLPDKERLCIFDSISRFSLEGIEPELTGICKTIWILIKPQIEANNRRYENGKKGGRPKQKESGNKPKDNQTETKPKPKEKEKEKYKEKDKYSEFVFLTKDEYQKLIEKFGEAETKKKIQELNDGIGSHGYKYKSHYHTILSWTRRNGEIETGDEIGIVTNNLISDFKRENKKDPTPSQVQHFKDKAFVQVETKKMQQEKYQKIRDLCNTWKKDNDCESQDTPISVVAKIIKEYE